MYRSAILGLALIGATTGLCHAQTWTHFGPPERDFRVIMPVAPSRTTSPDGKCSSYTASADNRLLAVTRCPLDPAQSDTNRRNAVIDRLGDGERSVNDRSDELGLAPGDLLFRVAGQFSAHRFVIQGNLVYELVVQVPEEDGPPRQLASDFFASFQSGRGLSALPALAARLAPESCTSRGNAFAKRFCEYLTCLVPANQAHPVCAALPRIANH